LLTYVAIGFVVPHQFLEGTTFRGGGLAWWFWISLYVVAFGSFIVFRLVRPLVLLGRHDLRVSAVTPLPDGSTSIEMTGKRLAALRPRPGQFLLWRFLDRDRWREAHPFSLSRQPHGDTLRITVKPSGDWTSRLGDVAVGTRVLAEGPLGVFSDVTRTQPGLVLISAGIGITPVRAMLEEHAADAGPCTVIVRARADDEAPLLDEVRALAAERGAALHVLIGPRGEGWAPAGQPTHLADVVDDVARCDVYVCGPEEWARAVEADALAAGVPAASIHREQFAW
jgi:ferredoxin-NADP reductase